MEEEQRRMESAVNDVLNTIDKKCLRTLQIQMHECAIECYKDTTNNIQSLEICNKNCTREIMAARSYVQNEFNKWQQRIQRCVEDCGDDIRDKMTNENEMNKYMKEAEACSSQCIIKHMKILPQLSNKIIDYLTNRKMY